MNLMIALLLLFVGTGGSDQPAKKPELKWKKLDAGLAEARRSGKKVMVDVYTDWCGWCKKLDRDVYGNDDVARYLNKQYVVVKLNAESSEKVMYKGKSASEQELAASFGVSGYPTIFFIDSNGEFINSLGGYVGPEKFLPIIQYIGEDTYKKMTWEEYQKTKSKD